MQKQVSSPSLVFKNLKRICSGPRNAVLGNYIDLPKPAPGAPGPFSLADQGATRELLTQASFKEIGFESMEKKVAIAKNKTAQEFVSIFSRANPTIRTLMQELDSKTQAQFTQDLENAFGQHRSGHAFEFETAVWVVQAKK